MTAPSTAPVASLPTVGSSSVGNGAVYWVGNNGQVYANIPGVSGGVQDEGTALDPAIVPDSYAATGANGKEVSGAATEIQNPDPSGQPAATGAANTSGSSTSSTPAASTTLDPATINAIMASIAGAQAQNQAQFQTATTENQNADQSAANQYNQDTQTNTESRAQAEQNALQAAASGNSGLKAVLASLGALGGTGAILAGRAVADSANNDIGGADTTYTNNKQAIQNAQTAYTNSATERDQALASNLNTDNADAKASSIQDLLNDAEEQGATATYNQFLPQLVQATTAQTQVPLASQLIPINSATTSSYAPNSSVNVTNAPAQAGVAASQTAAENAVTPVNSALYTNKTT